MQGKYGELAGVAKQSFFSGKWLNLSNFLTALRAVLALPIILLLLYPLENIPYDISCQTLAGLIFIFAALTDKLDGYLARKNDQVTRLGQFLDPLADKVLMIPVMITLWSLNLLQWWVVLIVCSREIMVSIFRVIGVRKGVSFPASWSGKAKMFSQIVAVSALILFPSSSSEFIIEFLIYAMTAITVFSGIDYLFRAKREIFQ
ncbi:MAG: CDP-diacylglycerol--glycerol-3-phosphate 3-phosphatidyltransferase [Actinomycetota bacterium]|nr:CDP-diacylglycerol--glycerol-3-phosphate 3-phosphatidyltransferase [Actinomycetota bacterium]